MRGLEWRKWMLIAAVVAAAVIKARFAWVPVWYLGLVIGAPALGWWLVRRNELGRPIRWPLAGLATAVTIALCPVPWMVAESGGSPGNAWRLDGRVTIDGRTIDPVGDWLWLTAGRPPTIAELAWSKVGDTSAAAPSSMRAGPLRKRAKWSEPAAAVVGLARGGWAIDTRLEAHVSEPTRQGLPASVVVASINGRGFDNAAEWVAALDALEPHNTMRTADGTEVPFDGADLPYAHVDTVITPTRDIDVVVGGWLARTPAGGWWRNLATGSSHGLMVALVAYTYASGDELAAGIMVAGTGSMRPDGSVGRIGGLRAKAGAARDAGADVLLYPADQADDLVGFVAGSMMLIGVATLDDAIAALDARRAG